MPAVLERGRPKEPTSPIRPSGPSTFPLLPAGTPKHSLPEAVAELRRAELCRSAFALAAELSRDAELLSVTPSGRSITDRVSGDTRRHSTGGKALLSVGAAG